MPQHNYIERFQKENGKGNGVLQVWEAKRKREARLPKNRSKMAKKLYGLKAKLYNKQRFREKVQMKKTIKQHEEKSKKEKVGEVQEGAMPAYLLDREQQQRSKILSNTLKQKRKEKAARWAVPVPNVKAMTEDQMFKIITSGKRKQKAWKRMITQPTFVPETFTRKPPKYERFIRPMGLRFKHANVTHPELKTTFQLPIVSVKKNPQSHMYTTLGVLTKGTIIEVNVADLGLVTPSGKVIFTKYCQINNNPKRDGCVNAILLTGGGGK